MPNYVDPAAFEGEPLILTRIGADDYSVRIGGKVAGRIMAQPRSGGRVVWLWSLTGPYLPEHLRPSSGDADSLDEAKAAFRARFDKWLAWAALLQHQVVGRG